MSQPHPHKYIRQATLPQIGPRGQHRLFEAHVGIVGCGTLGCVVADQLARAGVGRLTIADRDLVEAGNLQRQVLFDESDAAERTPKAQAAAVRLSEINADVSIEPVIADFRPSNAESLMMQGRHGKPDVIVDGTDNFETRFLINDLCVKHAIPYVYAGVVGTEAMRAVFDTRQGGACLRCVFDRPPVPGSQPTCETAGVLAPAAAIIGAMQAIEAIKLLLGSGQVATDLVRVDAWSGEYRSIDLCESKDPSCPCCVERCFDHLEGPEPEAASLCGRNAVQVMPMPGHRVDFEQLAAGMGTVGQVIQSPFMVRVALSELPEVSISVFRDGRAVIEGTEDPSRARALYARYVGA
ncbi:MAG: ThiF family adenylyltransferase [Phycisphaerales bacterium]